MAAIDEGLLTPVSAGRDAAVADAAVLDALVAAEVALTRGFDDVRLLTWPIPTLEAAGLPLTFKDNPC